MSIKINPIDFFSVSSTSELFECSGYAKNKHILQIQDYANTVNAVITVQLTEVQLNELS